MTKEFDIALTESLNTAHADRFAREQATDTNWLTTPLNDLALFREHMSGNRMLDIGCGWARYIEKFVEAGYEYHGIDISPAMIEVSRTKCPELDFQLMSYRSLDFPDSHFDGLWCCCVLEHEPKQNVTNVLAEWKRVLTAGGILYIITPFGHGSSEEIIEDDGLEFFYAAWDDIELGEVLEAAEFTIIEKNIWWSDGAMSFLVRK